MGKLKSMSEIRDLTTYEMLDYLKELRSDATEILNQASYIKATLQQRADKIQYTLDVMERNKSSLEYDYISYVATVLN